MLSKRAVGCSVLGNDVDEAIGVGEDGVVDVGVSVGARGISAGGDTGDKSLEEREGGRGDGDRARGLPHIQRIVELFSSSECIEVPRVTVVVAILRVSSDGDSGPGADTRVQGVDGSEGVNDDLVSGESSVGARLEGSGVAAESRVEGVDRA